jgi:4-amino-4-deoxy-L-arabinose transferase-like glycosyltransferase
MPSISNGVVANFRKSVNIVMLVILIFSARDVFETNRDFALAPAPLDKVSYDTLQWLKEYDTGLYYISLGDDYIWWFWLPAAYETELPVINFIYSQVLTTKVQQSDSNAPFFAKPKYVISLADQPPSDSSLVKKFEYAAIWQKSDALPFAFSTKTINVLAKNKIDTSMVKELTAFYDGPNSIVIEAESNSKENTLIVLTSNYPGWKLLIDQKPAVLEPVNNYLSAQMIEGKHNYTFIFRPALYYIGFAISLLTLCIISILIFTEMTSARSAKKRKTENAPNSQDRLTRIASPRSQLSFRFVEPIAILLKSIFNKALTWLNKLIGSKHISPSKLGMIAVSILLAIAARLAAGDSATMILPWAALSAWVAAILLSVLAGWKNQSPLKWPSQKMLQLSAFIFLMAFLPRIIFATQIPILLTGDEGSTGLYAALFASGKINNIFTVGWYSFPALYFTIPGFFIQLFGQDVLALRISSALAGALTVVSVFYLLRAAYNQRTAWVGAIFLSFLHVHLHFSRIGLNNIWDGLWFTVAAGALWYGWTHERRNAYLLSGLALGLSQYFYSSGRVLLVLILLWLVIVGWHDRARLKRSSGSLFFLGLVALVTLLPLALFYVNHPQEFLAPFNRVTILNQWLITNSAERSLPGWKFLLEQFARGFGAYVLTPLQAGYRPAVPILRPIPGVFFMIGLVFLFFNRQKKFNLMILLWVSAYAVVGALSESTPAAQRYVASAPAAAMLVAIGINESANFVTRRWPKTQKYVWHGILTVGLLLAVSEASFYFFDYSPKNMVELADSNSMVGYRMGLYLRQRTDHPQIYFLGAPRMGFGSIPSTQYLAPKFTEATDINHPWGSAQNPPVEGQHLLFIVLPGLQADLQAIQADYPGGNIRAAYSTNDQALFYLYEYKPLP